MPYASVTASWDGEDGQDDKLW